MRILGLWLLGLALAMVGYDALQQGDLASPDQTYVDDGTVHANEGGNGFPPP